MLSTVSRPVCLLVRSGRVVSGKQVDRYFCWLVRDLLGKQTVIDSKKAGAAGDRLVKRAKAVRAEDAARDAAARAAAHAQR